MRAFLLLSCAVVLMGCGTDVDPRLVGEWNTFLATPQGTWTAAMIIQEDGRYTTTFVGFPPRPFETGTMSADDGEFELEIDGGETDEGTYQLTSDNSLTVNAKRGTSYWQRAGTMPALPGIPPGAPPVGFGAPPPVAAPAQPTNQWPLVGVPALAKQALEDARRWRADAVPRGLSAELVEGQGGIVGNMQTDAGPVTLEFYFCSPSAGATKVIRPGASIDVPEQPGKCDGSRPMPEFQDFPAAVAAAQARGMTSTKPKSMAIEDMKGRGVAGEDLTDWVWRIVPPTSARESVQMFALNPHEEKVRVVDACAVVTLDDAKQAMGVPLTTGKAQYTTGNRTWSCAYQSPGSNSAGMTLLVDESPFRDKRGVMAMAQRGGQQAVPGLGDEAYFQLPGSGVASLKILLGDTLLELGVWGARNTEAAIKELGKLAVTRVVEGQGVATRASLSDQLVGAWTAKLYERSMLLTVRPDRSVNLQMAGEVIGAMNAKDGRYSLMTRARRALFDGSFEMPRPGRLVTRGPVEAQWLATTLPVQIHRTLITPGMLTETPADTGQWPQTLVEPALVGLWESNGMFNGRAARMLWRIRSNGPSQLTWALSGNGFVEAPNATYDRVIVRFADQLVADARNLGAAVDAEMIVESLASPTTFVTPGWSGFHGDLTWTKMP